MRRSGHFVATEDKPCMQVSLLIKSATYQSGVVCLILWSLFALCLWGPVLDFIQEAFKVVNQQFLYTFVIYQLPDPFSSCFGTGLCYSFLVYL